VRQAGTLVERTARAAEESPAAVAIADRSRTWDRAHVVGHAGGLSEVLRPLRGGIAAVLAEDARDLAVAALGSLATGMTLVPLDPRSGRERLRRTLEALGVTVLLHGGEAPDAPGVATVALRTVGSAPLRGERMPGNAVAVLFMSSGSTGEPKPVPRTHADLAGILTSPIERNLRPDDRIGTLLGATGAAVRRLLGALDAGVPIHMLDARGVDGADLLAAFAAARVSVLSLIPTYLRRILTAAGDRRAAGAEPGLPELRMVTTVGEQLMWSDVAAVRARLNPRCSVMNRYGSTDAASISHREVPPDEPIGDGAVPVGRPNPGVTVRIEDPPGHEVPIGTAGEVVVDSPKRRENPTRIDLPDGRHRYRTGDLGRVLPDGQLELIGRVDRLVKIGGIRVEPARIEAALRELPWVAEAFVDVEPDVEPPALTAHVAVRPGAEVDASAAEEFLRARLHEAEVPRWLVRHDGPLPTLLTGKVDPRRLRAGRERAEVLPLGQPG
jgi:acyl-coenzyme A synthetase/AMP-(fatty) acid ligase